MNASIEFQLQVMLPKPRSLFILDIDMAEQSSAIRSWNRRARPFMSFNIDMHELLPTRQ